MKNKKALSAIVSVVAFGSLASGSVMAYDTIGTVTGADGDVKELVSMSAEVVSVDGAHVSFKNLDTGAVYNAGFGPIWFTKEYKIGENIVVEGVETVAENNENDHTFQVTKVNDIVLREEFEGKPVWAGTRGGNGDGSHDRAGSRAGHGRHGDRSRSGFVDADCDGVCDNTN